MTKRILSLMLALILMLSCGVLSGAAEKANAGGEITTIPNEEKIAPEKITISGSHHLGIGKKIQLKASVSPSKASQKVTWKSGNRKIARVSKDGIVTGVKAGKVTITAVSEVKKSVRKAWTITVREAITKIEISAPEKTINLDESKELQLKAKVSPAAASGKALSWKSSNEDIATVSSSGKVTGKETGTVTITATAQDGSGKKASIKIKLVSESGSGKTTYRALLIAETTFLRYDDIHGYYALDANINTEDIRHLSAMLGEVQGPKGTKYKVTRKVDLTYNGIHNAIKSTFSGTKDSDVSLLFIASHGNNEGDGELEMAFTGDPENAEDLSWHYQHMLLPFSTLAAWLKKYVKGKVIIFVQSCGAGSCIYDPEEQNGGGAAKPIYMELTGKEQEAALKKIANNAVRAFEKADPGMVDENSTGDLRCSKFYVLTACRHRELSFASFEDDDYYNYFTKWLIKGVGHIGDSPADKAGNDDGMVDLTELFKYIRKVGDSYPIDFHGEDYYQHVQRYPVGSTYKLFKVR